MAKKRPVLTEEQRAQRRIEQRELVVASIEQLRSSDGWRAYLTARARFRSYSARNVLLILAQRTASHCLLRRGEMDIRSRWSRDRRATAVWWLLGSVERGFVGWLDLLLGALSAPSRGLTA